MLRTARLALRPFRPQDADAVQRLASQFAVADTTLTIPHPYPEGGAATWIATHEPQFREGKGVVFAIAHRADDALIGAIGLGIDRRHEHAELGYWIDPAEWNKGYATEAAGAIIAYGFAELQLHRIQARHFARNPSSGAVMRKLGMRCEGIQRGALKKGDAFEDVVVYAVLREEWPAR